MSGQNVLAHQTLCRLTPFLGCSARLLQIFKAGIVCRTTQNKFDKNNAMSKGCRSLKFPNFPGTPILKF